MPDLTSKALDDATWPDFARLVERHDGVWGGCWCMASHAEGVGRGRIAAQNRTAKEQRVREGRAHAAVVYDGPGAVGWRQFGPTGELPRIKHHRATSPDWTTPRLADHLLLRRAAAAVRASPLRR